MADTEYIKHPSLEDRIRVKLVTKKGKVIFFIVQYYAKINGKWKTIMRADNCHGSAHLHKYYLHSPEFKVLLDQDNNLAFNWAREHIQNNFLTVKENYLNN